MQRTSTVLAATAFALVVAAGAMAQASADSKPIDGQGTPVVVTPPSVDNGVGNGVVKPSGAPSVSNGVANGTVKPLGSPSVSNGVANGVAKSTMIQQQTQ